MLYEVITVAMMVLKYVFAAFLLFFCVTPLLAQASPFTVLFYNVENLYDCEKDSLKDDGEFLPDGDKYWTFYRLNNKLKAISKVIIASNKWDLPAVVGLCEVENAAVLKHLLYSNGLYQLGYRRITSYNVCYTKLLRVMTFHQNVMMLYEM